MAISDKKKCQSLINLVGQRVQSMRDDMAAIAALKAKYVTQSVDPTGTPLGGNVVALNTALTNLGTALNVNIFTQLIAAIVPSHSGDALDQE